MENWYGLKNEKIDEIESSISWFKQNDKKLINFLLEAWYIADSKQPGPIANSQADKVPAWLNRCYAINKDKTLPAEILPLVINKLQPFRIQRP